ncbi:mercuric reductase [soil metagenome]
MTREQYDAIVIGAGQGGGPLASALAGSGRKTALIERSHVGGTCVNNGCTPTKTLVASARSAHLASRSADYGVVTGSVSVDMEAVRARKRAIVESFRSGSEQQIEQTEGLDLIRGEARFSGATEISVTMVDGSDFGISAKNIFINGGARPAIPPISGLDRVPYLDSTSVMELDQAPKHLLILGSGYVGLEFAQMFRRFGSQVTIVARGSRLLSREDEDIASAILEVIEEDGISVLFEASVLRAEATIDEVRLVIRGDGGEREVAGSHLLMATGRRPNSDHLDLDKAGIATDDHGYIRVDDRLKTAVDGVYALGDIKGGPAFTHVSYDDFRILRTNLIEGGSATTAGRQVPYVVYIDPQLGRIGLSEAQAREQGRPVRVATMPMERVARALEVDETRGMMKVIVDAESDRILGAAILGIEGGELMSMIQIAMMGEVPYTALRDGMFAHPTLAESFNNLLASFVD